MPPTEATTKPLGSNGYCLFHCRNKKDLAEGKTGLAWKVVLIWQVVCTLRTAICALSTQHEFCHYWSPRPKHHTQEKAKQQQSNPTVKRPSLRTRRGSVCCVAPPSSLTVSPRRNRPAHCAADVVKERPLSKTKKGSLLGAQVFVCTVGRLTACSQSCKRGQSSRLAASFASSSRSRMGPPPLSKGGLKPPFKPPFKPPLSPPSKGSLQRGSRKGGGGKGQSP